MNFRQTFRKVFGEKNPTLSIEILDALNHLTWTRRKNYPLEHSEGFNQEKINKIQKEENYG